MMLDEMENEAMVKIDVLNDSRVTRKTSSFVFWNRARTFIMILSLICLTLSQINSLTFTFTVICMEDVVEEHHRTNQTGLHFMESNSHKSMLFSGTAVGAMLGLVPSVPLIARFGPRNILTLSGMISAFGSLLFPIAVSLHYYLVFFCRVLQGIGISTIFTAVAVIPVVWSPNNEMGTFLAVLSCALQGGSVICMAVSGVLCTSTFGWRSIYYIFGIATFFSYIVFFFSYKDTPHVHRNVSEKELSHIQTGKIKTKGREPVPYRAIVSDPCVITCLISVFGGNLGFFILVLYGPTYLKNALGFDVEKTGFASSFSFFLSAVAKIIAGQISDRMDYVSEKTRFIMCAAVSQVGMAAGYLVIMAITEDPTIAQIAYSFAIVCSGINVMGTVKCLQLRCRQHVHFGISVVSFTAKCYSISAQFALLFYIIAGIIIIANIPFPFLSTAKPGFLCLSRNFQR
ncbi:unnamed protein product [Caenorhabditis angaria]|uniref:Major facilitator superfamily (MFS) profile domain-containing protein n=1 Tax=Caenorhabditis angaria TaxID=860376 RepID=A0A9P1IUT2_9PELO|nr:unnamed protein product [Caenorhabditis angaria]